MTALYAEKTAAAGPETAALVDAALVIDPRDVVGTVIAVDGDEVVGHAALRMLGDLTEIKKVFVAVPHRGRGISRQLLAELETIGRERGAESLVLHTGDLQLDAISLYEHTGYVAIPVYGAYGIMPHSLCFEKRLG